MSFSAVTDFERAIADYWGSEYAVATDCCTHAIELCLRLLQPESFSVPKHTYISIPQLSHKLNIPCEWRDDAWQNFYHLGNTNIIDSAVYWKPGGYIQDTLQCLSFQYKKPLNLGRGGAILCTTVEEYSILKAMAYDGRDQNSSVYWGEQDITTCGYHYYMTPETALLGIDKLPDAELYATKQWSYTDYPDCSKFSCFVNSDLISEDNG